MGAWKQYFNTFMTDIVDPFDMATLLFFLLKVLKELEVMN